jgi:superfamily II DNA/RNA helicase
LTCRLLEQANVPAGLLHTGRTQLQRDEALQCFRFGVTPVLVATGLAARGLDLPDVTALVNYDMPGSLGEYARRLGRLGRGGQPGVATTLFGPGDAPLAGALVAALRGSRQPVPEWLEDLARGSSKGGQQQQQEGDPGAAQGQEHSMAGYRQVWPGARVQFGAYRTRQRAAPAQTAS